MSLLSRTNQQNQTDNNQNNTPAPAAGTPTPAPAANNQQQNQANNNNQQQNNAPTPPPFGSRFGGSRPAPAQNRALQNTIVTGYPTLVRFDLDGLGDPFYRVLGQPLNTENNNINKLSQVLESGGDLVDELVEKLDEIWRNCDLTGAAMVYSINNNMIPALMNPQPMPNTPRRFGRNRNQQENVKVIKPQILRAIDLPLTLNVLTRARKQVLLARAPIVFGAHYLQRSLLTDDPRLVALAQASGAVKET